MQPLLPANTGISPWTRSTTRRIRLLCSSKSRLALSPGGAATSSAATALVQVKVDQPGQAAEIHFARGIHGA